MSHLFKVFEWTSKIHCLRLKPESDFLFSSVQYFVFIPFRLFYLFTEREIRAFV